MKIIKYLLIMVVISNIGYVFAVDDISYDNATIKANQYYFWIDSEISIAKDKSNSQYRRELAFKNLADMLQSGPGGGLTIIKDGFLEILIKDPNFFFNELGKVSGLGAYKIWIEKLNLNWLYAGESRYPELKKLAIKSLTADIKKTEELLKIKKETLQKIKSIKPTVVH
jgi:hypothetical protein